jgi:hypothetical protein
LRYNTGSLGVRVRIVLRVKFFGLKYVAGLVQKIEPICGHRSWSLAVLAEI